MLVVSQNLTGIVEALNICRLELVEEFSIQVRLDSIVRRALREPRSDRAIVFGTHYEADSYFMPQERIGRDLTLIPGDNVLACSADEYIMPKAYFGLLQTKGSLGRLFVSATCNDGQIEPGYSGKITLEITNHGTYPVTIPVGSPVAQMFVFRCTSEVNKPYDGRYQYADCPTLAKF